MTDDVGTPDGDRRAGTARRRTVVVASLLYLAVVAVLVLVWAVSARSEGREQVVIVPWTDAVLVGAGIMASVVLLSVIVFAVPARRLWWALLVPLRVVAIGAVALGSLALSLMDESATPIVADGCETGYVVSERAFLFAASGTVLRMDGLIGTPVDHTRVDDGHKPFEQRSYIAVAQGDTVRVWNTFESASEPLSTSSEPSFVLPRRTTETGCGLAGGIDPAARPSPTASTDIPALEGPLPSPVGDARQQLAHMAEVTLRASTGTPRDAAGSPVRAPTADELSCDGPTGVDLTFSTGDNASSYAAILAAWDAEGYSADRAMQEDLRDNGVVRLSARDRSTIDGLLHFSLSADCRLP